MKDWAEVHHLKHREKKSERAIARLTGMSRNTVKRLLALEEPPRYERPRRPSQLDPHKETILGLLKEDATAPSSVILERLRREGYPGGLTILKDFLKQERPRFLALTTYQRTTIRVFLKGREIARHRRS